MASLRFRLKSGQHLWRRLTVLALCAVILTGIPAYRTAWAETEGTLTAKVVLRKAASKDSKAVQTLPEGDTVTVLDSSGDWYKIRYGKYSGYVMKSYVQVSKQSDAANADAIAKLGDAPGPLRAGDEGNDVTTLQKALKILGFYTQGADGKYGNGTQTAVALYQQSANLTPDGVAGQATIKSIFGSCAKTADLTVSASSATTTTTTSDTSSGEDGSASDTVAGSDAANTVASIEDIGTAPSACKEGSSGDNVVKIQQALELLGYYNGNIDGDYGTQTVEAVKRFQTKRGMNADGIAGASTIRVMFNTGSSSSKTSTSSSKSSYKTEVLDWFADDVSSLIPKKAIVTIKDVRTGKTFKGKRWSGVNHMDTEPLTAEDTAIMKSIYGGSWSWNRRPILILYKNHVYAASMNGMPHGTTTISNNNFDGHFCIHFKNSRTHGTNKVDAAHQKAVAIAAKASW